MATTSEDNLQFFVDLVVLAQTSLFALSGMSIKCMLAWNLVLLISCFASASVHLGIAGTCWTMFRLFLSTSVLAALLCLITAYRQSALRHSFEDTRKNTEMQAVRKLLDVVCDAVVELDGSLKLIHHSPKLAAVLLRKSGRSLKGQGLEFFMSTEDQKRYLHVMQQPPSKEMLCSARVVHFSAHSFNHSVGIEMFSVPFEALDKSIHHLVGVREFPDVFSTVSEASDLECQQETTKVEMNGDNQRCSLFESCPLHFKL